MLVKLFQTSRTLYRQTTYRLLFLDPGNRRYMFDVSMQITADPNLLTNCFKKLERWCPDLKFPAILVDSHPQSPLKKYPIRANFLPRSDGTIQPILYETEKSEQN